VQSPWLKLAMAAAATAVVAAVILPAVVILLRVVAAGALAREDMQAILPLGRIEAILLAALSAGEITAIKPVGTTPIAA